MKTYYAQERVVKCEIIDIIDPEYLSNMLVDKYGIVGADLFQHITKDKDNFCCFWWDEKLLNCLENCANEKCIEAKTIKDVVYVDDEGKLVNSRDDSWFGKVFAAEKKYRSLSDEMKCLIDVLCLGRINFQKIKEIEGDVNDER